MADGWLVGGGVTAATTVRRAAEAGDRCRRGVLSLPGAMVLPLGMPWSAATIHGRGSRSMPAEHSLGCTRCDRMPAIGRALVQPLGSSACAYHSGLEADRVTLVPAHRYRWRLGRHSSWLLWRVHSLEQPSRTAVL